MIFLKNGFNLAEIKKIGRRIFEAVKYCHDKGISHRDLKPDNILINGEGKIKLIDFGLGIKQINKSKKHFCCVGTLSYMAPEVLKKESCLPMPTDVWGLGIILVKMYTKKVPYKCKRIFFF